MKSFKTEMKKVFEKGLKPYGFVKAKSKEHYYVRMINDEILHIISYREEFTIRQNYKAFVVLFGVATVYRKEIALDESLKYSGEWLNELSFIPDKEKDFAEYKDTVPFRFEYNISDESEMREVIDVAFELTEKFALPTLEKIVTTEECVKHFFKYKPSLMYLFADDRYVLQWLGGSHNEGLLCTMVYGNDRYEEYVKIQTELFEKFSNQELEWIKNGKSGLTMEQHNAADIEREKDKQEFINTFKLFVSDSDWREKICNELEQRRTNNTVNLKKWGIEVSINTNQNTQKEINMEKFFGCNARQIDAGMSAEEITKLYLEECVLGAQNGYVPVFVSGDDGLMEQIEYKLGTESNYTESVLSSDSSDGKEIFERLYKELENTYGKEYLQLDEAALAMMEEIGLNESVSTYLSFQDRCEEVYLVQVPADKPYEIFAWLPFGGWNECPDTKDMIAMCRYWYEEHGAMPAFITHDTLTFYLKEPVKDTDKAVSVSKEQCAFCSDILGMGGMEAYFMMSMNANVWTFWWD